MPAVAARSEGVWRGALVPVLAGLMIVGCAIASHFRREYGFALLGVVGGFCLLSGWFLATHARAGVPSARAYLKRISILVAGLMVSAYAFAAAGMLAGAFSDEVPAVLVSSLYLALPAGLVLCALAMERWEPAYEIANRLLWLIAILAAYCAYVIIDLVIEVPVILREHLTEPTQVHFYNTLMLFFALLGTLTIAAGLWRTARLSLAESRDRQQSPSRERAGAT